MTTSKVIYVAKTGNDSTGDGTSGKPFLTIQKAINYVATLYGPYSKQIIIGDGTYEESLNIYGISGGLQFSSQSADASKVIISSTVRCVNIEACGLIRFYNVTFTCTNYTRIINVYFAYVSLSYCVINGSGTPSDQRAGIHYSCGSVGSMENCTFNNIYSCLGVAFGSQVYAYNLSGASNTVAYNAQSGIIHRSGTTPTATTLESKAAGGQIFS